MLKFLIVASSAPSVPLLLMPSVEYPGTLAPLTRLIPVVGPQLGSRFANTNFIGTRTPPLLVSG